MATHYTNGDRILQAVLADPKLAELGEYTPTGDETVADALDSENAIIRAVAMIIYGNENQYNAAASGRIESRVSAFKGTYRNQEKKGC